MNPEIRVRVAKILSLALGQPVDPISNFSREDHPNWDSLKHVEMILMLEGEFGVRFTAGEVALLGSLDDIVQKVLHKNAS